MTTAMSLSNPYWCSMPDPWVSTGHTLKIVIVSASQAERSRSRLAALYAQDCLKAHGLEVNFIDLQESQILSYPYSENDSDLITLKRRFEAADGWVLAVPVYNWGPSGVLTNFLHYALNCEPPHRFRPFVLLGGVGGLRSHLALDGLARTLVYEMSAVQVGPAIMAAGSLVDRATGVIAPELQERLQHSMEALVHFTAASAALRRARLAAALPVDTA